MKNKKTFPLIESGWCASCFGYSMELTLVFGLGSDSSWDYLCPTCFKSIGGVPTTFLNCTDCGCFLNKAFRYPEDCSVRDQKPYCGLCIEYLKLEECFYEAVPKSERKHQEKVLENLGLIKKEVKK